MTGSKPAPGKKTGATISIVSIVLMGLVTIATAFCGYQASIWNGRATSISGQGSAARSQSAAASISANQLTIIDVMLFSEWMDAYSTGNTAKAEYFRQRFRPETKPAFEKWLEQDPFKNPQAPSSPFVMKEYVLKERLDAARLEQEANDLSEKAGSTRQRSQELSMTTILLASASFLAGTTTRLEQVKVQLTTVIMSGLLFAWAVFRIVVILAG